MEHGMVRKLARAATLSLVVLGTTSGVAGLGVMAASPGMAKDGRQIGGVGQGGQGGQGGQSGQAGQVGEAGTSAPGSVSDTAGNDLSGLSMLGLVPKL